MDIQIYENFDEILDKISEYRLVNKQEELEVLSNRLLEHEHDDEYSYMTALGYYALAEVRYLQKNFLECMSLHWKVHFICEHNEFPRLHALSSNLAGKASGSQGDYHNSVTLFLQGYYIAREHKYTDVEAWILNNIGTLFFTLEHYEEAILYFERAMNLIENGFQFVQEFHEILIMNIISAYLHMKNFHEVEIWTKKFYDLFPHTKNALISSGMQMKKVLHAYDIKALHLFKKEVKHLVQITQEHWTGNYAVQILLETGELCYELECYEEMELSLHHLRDHIQVIDYRHRIQLSNLLIKLYQVTKQKIALFDELNMYYDLTKKFEDLQRSIELKGLKSKIVLEKEITAKKKIIEKNEELTALSERDPYTGLLHKQAFMKYVSNCLQTSLENKYHVLVIIDIDNFKYINDTYGHLIGDEVIKLLSNNLISTFRLQDYIGRIGGDEFCVYVQGEFTEKSIHDRTNTLRVDIENMYVPSCEECKISVSIGVFATKDALAYKEAFMMADQALYEAKKQGKNTYQVIIK